MLPLFWCDFIVAAALNNITPSLSARLASCSRPNARMFLKKRGGGQTKCRETQTRGLTVPYLSSHSLFDSLFLILYLRSPSPPTALFRPLPVSSFPPSSSVLHLLFFFVCLPSPVLPSQHKSHLCLHTSRFRAAVAGYTALSLLF